MLDLFFLFFYFWKFLAPEVLYLYSRIREWCEQNDCRRYTIHNITKLTIIVRIIIIRPQLTATNMGRRRKEDSQRWRWLVMVFTSNGQDEKPHSGAGSQWEAWSTQDFSFQFLILTREGGGMDKLGFECRKVGLLK